MMKATKSIWALLLTIVLIGCEQTINLDLPDYKEKLVVGCIMEPGENALIGLTHSEERVGYVHDLDTIELIPDALITIQSVLGEQNCPYFGGFGGFAVYFSEMDIPSSGALSLRVEGRGEVVTAETEIPSKATIKSAEVGLETINFLDFEYESLILTTKINDVPNEANYYRIGYSFSQNPNSEISSTPASEGSFYLSDAGNDGGELSIVEELPFFSSFDDEEVVFVDVFIQNLSKSAFDYLSTAEAQEALGDATDLPFTEPIPVNGNIENGLGVFGVIVNSEPLRISFTP